MKEDGALFFHNVNVDESGQETNVILVAGESGPSCRVSIDMISTMTKSNLGKKGLIWLKLL
jgi:hypothetical protein